MAGFKLKVTPEMESLTQVCVENSKMDPSLYGKYDVKRGLRDVNGKGVLAGLTQISSICSTDVVDGKTVPCEGRLYYRGYDIHELTQGFLREQRFGFEEVTYLLLFGKLPNEKELADFKVLLAGQRSLPKNFVRDVIMKAPTKDMMNPSHLLRLPDKTYRLPAASVLPVPYLLQAHEAYLSALLLPV